MQADLFDEAAFFAAIARSGSRALLIGRRALIVLGIPVLTAEYDFWLQADDIEALNSALAPLDMVPNHAAAEARSRGRYILENGEHVDVLVARVHSTTDGQRVTFDEVWSRRQLLVVAPGVEVALPTIPDLIAIKRFGGRAKDAEDIRALELLIAGNRDG
jgi:hypothetical protein